MWAPRSQSVRLVVAGGADRALDLDRTADGYFEGVMADVGPAARYVYELADGGRYADPASRFQPDGPHGASAVVDPDFPWTDQAWMGVKDVAPVVYEMHIGTFTHEGTWSAAARELPALATLGVRVIEMLPVAEFPGRFGWGYDGVLLFAPSHLYGSPDDLRRFVDDAHRLELAVILDVVYNHFGPDGCFLDKFSSSYFSAEGNEWGNGLNFGGEESHGTRTLILSNAGYWIEEFHFDGLRLDATQAIHDDTTPHILAEIRRVVAERAGRRRTWVIAECETQDTTLLRPVDVGGHGLDALWNDDFHHSAMVALTGRREAYYTDYLGTPQEFISCAKRGFLYQGQWYAWQQQPRGRSTRRLPPAAFVAFLQNHDQLANSFAGVRLHGLTSPGRCRAVTALLLLGPWPPLLFQGQEFQASSPFLYFADHHGELGERVKAGRREFLRQFPSLSSDDVARQLTDPTDEETFRRSRIDHAERDTHQLAFELHRSLLAVRHADPAFHTPARFEVDGAVLDQRAFALRFIDRDPDAGDGLADRLIVVNLGPDLKLPALSEPLLSPYPAREWRALWSSDDPAVGGTGRVPFQTAEGWQLSAESALVLAPGPVLAPGNEEA